MKRKVTVVAVWLMVAAGLCLILSGGLMAAEDSATETPIERYCTACHGLDRIQAKKQPAVKWWMTIHRMASYDGADLDAAQQKEVFDYLKINLATDGPGGREKTLENSMEKALGK